MKNPASKIIDTLSQDTLLSNLPGMTERSLRHARSVGYFAARWYALINGLCEARGIDCPMSAFNFCRPSTEVSQSEGSLPDTDIRTETDCFNSKPPTILDREGEK